MSITFDIINISIDNSNETGKVILINCIFEYKDITWKIEKTYDMIIKYFNDLINIIPNILRPPLIIECNNNIELFKQKFKEYFNNLLKRKEIYKLFSFQKTFEFPEELIEKQITIDTLSNITEYNIFDFYFYEPYLFISCGNSNSLKALGFLFSYFEPKGYYLIYKINNLPSSYGEKKLTEISKNESEKYITKFKRIKDFLFLGYNNGNIEIISFNKDKKEPFIYSKIDNIENKMSINENYKISNIFYKVEKGLIYIFIENDKKVSIYEINNNNHFKDIKLTDNPIIYSYISFDMNKIFVIDSYGTFWIYDLIEEINEVKLLQASYTKLYNITTAQIFNEKNNDQTLNIFIGESNKVHLYQYSNKNNKFSLKLTCNIQFKINYIIYVNQYKCLMIGCDNGTIQIWKDSLKAPEYIIESGYLSIDKLFYDDKNKYIFINNNKNLKIIEIDLENILINENDEREINEEEKNKKNMIAETLKDEEDKVAENNILLLSKAFQTPESSPNQNKEDKKDKIFENKNEKHLSIDKDTENDSNIDENEYNYEVRNIDSLDGWNEW
jgi:hypothetical protein